MIIEFNSILIKDLENRLKYICSNENIVYNTKSIKYKAKN